MIDGTGHIVFKSGSTEIAVEKVRLLDNEWIGKYLRAESDDSNVVKIISLKDRHLVQFRYHIYKYGAISISKYKSLMPYNDTYVKFRFYAGNYFKDITGAEADYFLTIKKKNWDTPELKDILIITFESKKPIDFMASALPDNVRLNNDGTAQVNNDGTLRYG